MKHKLAVLIGVAGILCPVAQLYAHHSFAAEYDEKKVIVLKGTVTRFDWLNPHLRFYVDVKDDKGNVTNWDLELMSPKSRSSIPAPMRSRSRCRPGPRTSRAGN